MKILIVGGTGLIGGHAALYLRSIGHEVTLAGRHRPERVPLVREFPFIQGDYIRGEITLSQLKVFDAIVFAAGSDVRHIPQGENGDDHFQNANGVAIPAFARLARSAGVRNFVHIGSFYPHIAPEQVEKSAYVRSRKVAADEVAALTQQGFSSCSLDAPIIVGLVPGMSVPLFTAIVKYAEGILEIPPYAPSGGSNFMSVKSLSQAIAGALGNGDDVAGKSILLGDQNLSFAAFLKMFFVAVGRDDAIPTLAQDHPLFPKATIYSGDSVVSYEPNQEEVGMLGGYDRDAIASAVHDLVLAYRTTP